MSNLFSEFKVLNVRNLLLDAHRISLSWPLNLRARIDNLRYTNVRLKRSSQNFQQIVPSELHCDQLDSECVQKYVGVMVML